MGQNWTIIKLKGQNLEIETWGPKYNNCEFQLDKMCI